MHGLLALLVFTVAFTLSRAAPADGIETCILHTGRLRLWGAYNTGGDIEPTNSHIQNISAGNAFTYTLPLAGAKFSFTDCPNRHTFQLLCTTCGSASDPDVAMTTYTVDNSERDMWMFFNYGPQSTVLKKRSDVPDHQEPWSKSQDFVYDGTFVIPVTYNEDGSIQPPSWAIMNDQNEFYFTPNAINQVPFFGLGWEEDE